MHAGADDICDEVVVLRHDEGAKMVAGLLVKDAAVGLLKLQHPGQVPEDLFKVVRQVAVMLGDAEIEVAQGLRVELPRPQECAAGDAGVDDVAAVVAGIMPAAMIRQVALLAGGCP